MNKENILKILKIITIISFVFSLMILSLLLINYIQYKINDPLNSKALLLLREQFKNDQANKNLIDQIRSLDLLSRKAFFTSTTQIEYGKILLLIGVVIFFVSINIYGLLDNKIKRSKKNELMIDNIIKYRFLLMTSGVSFLVIGIVFSFMTFNDFNNEKLFVDSLKSMKPEIKPPSISEIKNNWQTFRGMFSQGISYTNSCPEYWDVTTGKNIAWKSEITKKGYNSPIVWNDRIFISGADDKSRDVYCYDFSNGNLLWRYVLNDGNVKIKNIQISEDNGLSTPTMTTNGTYVYAAFATGHIVALDFNGKMVWDFNFGIPKNHYGYASSLLIYNNILLFQNDQEGGGYLAGINSSTGKIFWQTGRDVSTSWASPELIEFENKYQVVLAASPYLTGYDPETGKELWKIDCLSGEVGSSPAYSGGIVYTANKFSQLTAYDIKAQKIIWYYEDNLPDASSPIAYNGYIILPTPNGVVTCLNSKDGKVYWEKEFESGFYSSPVVCGDKIYLIDRSGICHIFKLAKTYQKINDVDLKDKVVATPAFYKDRIIIRTEKYLYCIEEK